MPNISQMIESKYLKQGDVDHDMPVTVVKVGQKNIAKEGDEPELKWLVKFEELAKPMVLNATNIKRLARACNSNDTDDWTGKKVILYVDPDVEFAGNVVGGLRIRSLSKTEPVMQTIRQQPAKPTGSTFDSMDDDVPF